MNLLGVLPFIYWEVSVALESNPFFLWWQCKKYVIVENVSIRYPDFICTSRYVVGPIKSVSSNMTRDIQIRYLQKISPKWNSRTLWDLVLFQLLMSQCMRCIVRPLGHQKACCCPWHMFLNSMWLVKPSDDINLILGSHAGLLADYSLGSGAWPAISFHLQRNDDISLTYT